MSMQGFGRAMIAAMQAQRIANGQPTPMLDRVQAAGGHIGQLPRDVGLSPSGGRPGGGKGGPGGTPPPPQAGLNAGIAGGPMGGGKPMGPPVMRPMQPTAPAAVPQGPAAVPQVQQQIASALAQRPPR